MKTLWTFDSPSKLEQFIPILQRHGIAYETSSKGTQKTPGDSITVSVDEGDFEKAKKLLLKHRKRRTSGDYL